MTRYADRTDVSPEKTRIDIERTLQRYGAEEFIFGWSGGVGIVGFRLGRSVIKMRLKLPPATEFQYTPTGLWRNEDSRNKVWAQAVRQRWRALLLVLKAKLEAVESGIESVEEAFMAHLVLPSGQTVAEWLVPQIEDDRTRMPTGLLPALSAGVIEGEVVE